MVTMVRTGQQRMESLAFVELGYYVSALLIAGTTAAGYLGWIRLRRRLEAKKPIEGLPTPPNSHWLTGHRALAAGEKDFRAYLAKWIKGYANEYGQVGLWVYSMPTVMVTQPEDAGVILRAEHQKKRVALLERHANKFLGPKSLVLLQGREWKYHRAAVLRSFGPAAIEASKRTISDVTDTAIRSLRARMKASPDGCVEIEVEQLTKMVTVDVFGRVAFSKDLECTKHLAPSPIAKAFDFLGSELTRRTGSPLRPANVFYSLPTPANLKHYRERSILRSFLKDVIEERKSSQEKKSDLLSELLGTLDEGEDPSVDQTLQDVLLTLLFAGYDTTSITLSYALYLVSRHPDVEDAVIFELQSANSLDDREGLKYCEAVINETLRLYPPAIAVSRYLQKPLQLQGGFVAAANTNVLVSIWLIHHDERNFKNPVDFRPDRWVKFEGGRWVDREETDESGTIPAANRKAFFAFSAGARSCAGQKLAMEEGVLVFAGLMKVLRFRPVEGFELTPTRQGLVQRPNDGLPMIIQER